jgi:hypothetical protein
MPSFESMFRATHGKPIEYQGKKLHMLDHFPVAEIKRIHVIFEECNGEWTQGVRLVCDGECRINGSKIASNTPVTLWQNTAPSHVEIELSGDTKEIRISNIWDTGDGVTHCWHNGAAMIVEELPNGRRYRCNDGFADDDFDDIVFRLERE